MQDTKQRISKGIYANCNLSCAPLATIGKAWWYWKCSGIHMWFVVCKKHSLINKTIKKMCNFKFKSYFQHFRIS